MVRNSTATSARTRAREAHARQLAERRNNDRKVEEAAIAFYEASDRAEQARHDLAAAERDQATSVARLGDLGQNVSEVAALCGITQGDVRTLRKLNQTEQGPEGLLDLHGPDDDSPTPPPALASEDSAAPASEDSSATAWAATSVNDGPQEN
jgi:hypothetical protein